MKKYAYILALLVLFSGCSALQEKPEPSSVSAVSSLASPTAPDESSGASAQEDTQAARAQLYSMIMNTSADISKMDQSVTDALIRLAQALPAQRTAAQEEAPAEPVVVSPDSDEQISAQAEQQPAVQETPVTQMPSAQETSAPQKDTAPAQPTDTQPSDTIEEPVLKPKATISSTNFLSKVEDQVLALINEERINQGFSPLTSDPDLKTSARIRSKELYESGTFAHQRPNGDEWSTVITQDVPIKFIAAGENLCTTAYNDPNLNSAYDAQFWFDRWYNSPDHYENMVRPNFTHVGVGIYCMEKDGFIYAYATTIFAEF
ncbi:CAP domain-containing protein [Anaerotruncus colihominis]|jgi:uncharacterized protein YkwD|uniref:CAP domain-containing protein n=2 Tax=Anaerotruncus TaxID=244127 RepID=UPI00216D2F30|nr:CAP domain-containing protein [Anaerotruncus colihominis]MCI8492417.1 hypothetical protein [Anaerotruncus sp.]